MTDPFPFHLIAARRACPVRTFLPLAAALVSAAAGAQSGPVPLSIDHFLTHPITGESRHEILPVAVYDGTRFRQVREWDPVLGESSRGVYLLRQYPVVQVLRHGERIGDVSVSDIHVQGFQCSSLIVGTGNYTSSVTSPSSDIGGITRRRENGELIDYATETFLALSRATDEPVLDDGPVISDVTDPEELERYAMDVERIAPRPELLPLGINETRAYRVDGQSSVLVVRKRQTAGTVEGPGDSRIEGTLYADFFIVRAGAGQRTALPLLRTQRNGLGGGTTSYFIDAFALPDGTVYLAFELRFSEAVNFMLYQLGAISDTRLVFETVLHGC